jgi:hypothetical protein
MHVFVDPSITDVFVVRLLPLRCCLLLLLLQVNAEVRFLLARLNFSDFYTRSPAADKQQQ